eukprot:Gregarina_sp_Pseudo_9__1845@NODE_225_length_3521_cov_97_495405_g209_i0_p1_GENE_NODE_225_length_3521_cov_97_495405_g209_i0NODE_225_length_3521_cov_97_495405_g209_i0_p1_ORF_typecomplete_len481_score93_92Peptidase_M20/PF01546_28/5_3e47M20_dimer/PF07687_14/4_7e03M20_dimer/PF07687_14/1_3e19Peptidase_M28/PF04389_17/9_9e05_NODE_225_length_3521_cov_97_495405_g209_i019863428
MTIDVDKVFGVIDSHIDDYVQLLSEAVSIKSVSAMAPHRNTVCKMAEWIKAKIESDWKEAKVDLHEIEGMQTLDGQKVGYPPIITAHLQPHNDKLKTLLVYAHYDVQPAELSDGWDSDPWTLTKEADGQLRGRGSTDDKGPLVGWLCMLKSYQAAGIELPVNIRFVFEGMEESGSEGFDETIQRLTKTTDFFKDIDFVCISDNYWLSTKKPCLTYGLRGLCTCEVAVSGPAMDLHSGSFGGQVFEPMDDLLYLLGSLKDKDNKILIPGIMNNVMEITEEEKKRYEPIYFDMNAKKKEIGMTRLRDDNDQTKCLMNVWRLPSLTVHGIEGAFSSPGFKTVIPRKVIGKFSIRLVPNMQGEEVQDLIEAHLKTKMTERNSACTMSTVYGLGRWWYTEPTSKCFEAAKRATERVHGVTPDFTREGGSIPITVTLNEATKAPVCLLPMGRCDDGAHSQNEKLDLSNYTLGMRTFAVFLDELSLC